MNKHLLRNVAVAGIGLAIILVVWAGLRYGRPPADSIIPPADETVTAPASSTEQAATTMVKVALFDYTGEKPGKSRGCDHVILVDREIPATPAPLTGALTELFSIKETNIDGLGNFIPRTRATLAFDHVVIDGGVAKVYLIGKLSGLAGVCDNPRASIQIEETALQFPTVKSVELYLNGERTSLQTDEKGE